MAILTDSGRMAIARAIQNEVLHLAWGRGDPAWDDEMPSEDMTSTALVWEVGRRRASVVGYCLPDPEGEIVTTDGRFRQTETPTKHLFFRFAFDFEDGADAEIRELAVFLGGQTDPALPPGQMYFSPAQVIEPGTLLLLEHIGVVRRSPNARTTYETVFTI